MYRAFVALCLFSMALATPRQGTVNFRSPDPIIIDGVTNEWKDQNKLCFLAPTGGDNEIVLLQITDSIDCSAQFYAVWDNTYLYLAAQTRDDTLTVSGCDSNSWLYDCLELWVTKDYDDADAYVSYAPYLGTFGYHLTFMLDDSSNCLVLESPSGPTSVSRTNFLNSYGSEYAYLTHGFEIKIPWSSPLFNIQATSGNIIGISVGIADRDSGNYLSGYMRWTNRDPNEATHCWARMTLVTPRNDTTAPVIALNSDTTMPLTKGVATSVCFNVLCSNPGAQVTYQYGRGCDRVLTTQSTVLEGFDTSINLQIPEPFITETGVAVNVSAVDGPMTTHTKYDMQVCVPSLRMTATLLYDSYCLFSFPIQPKRNTLGDVIADDLGSPSPYSWRVFEWVDGYVERTPTDRLQLGHAYWVRTRKQNARIGIDTALSTATVRPFEMKLSPGWHAVGVPFAAPIDWVDIVTTSDTGLVGPYYWNGASWDNPLDHLTLEPWQGYYIRNSMPDTIHCRIPPLRSTGMAKRVAQTGWLCHVTVTQGNRSQHNDIFGVQERALCQPEPPASPNGTSLEGAFKEGTTRLMTDVHVTADVPWSYEIQGLLSNALVTVSFDSSIEGLFIRDQSTGTVKKIDRDGYQFQPSRGESVRQLAIFHDDNSSIKSSIPNQFRFVVGRDRICYEIPVLTEVEFVLYSLNGRKVTTIYQGIRNPGRYELFWKGFMSPGLYLIRMRAGDYYTSTRGMFQWTSTLSTM